MAVYNNFWVLRQNYGEITSQSDMKSLIMEQKIVTCPWGGWGLPRQNVIDSIYNENDSDMSRRKSNGQDRRFVEEIQIGILFLFHFVEKKNVLLLVLHLA